MENQISKTKIQPRRLNSLRHPEADYSEIGAYFITICTRNREPLFGEVHNEQMQCNNYGFIIWNLWKSLPLRYPQISISSAMVMPDHFHGIIEVVGEVHVNFASPSDFCERDEPPLRQNEPPLPNHPQPRRVMTIPLVVGYFKMITAKQINNIRETSGTHVWQRNYYDRIIESDEDYAAISEYILTNPSRWGLDKD